MWIDGARFWHIDEYRGFKVRLSNNPLPSDCRFREDLVFLRNGDEETAATWKAELEKRQRHEQKLRDKITKA